MNHENKEKNQTNTIRQTCTPNNLFFNTFMYNYNYDK